MNAKQVASYSIVALVLVTAWYLGVAWLKKAHPEWVWEPPVPQQPQQPTSQQSPQTQPASAPGTATAPATQAGPEAAPPSGQLRAVRPEGSAPASAATALGSAARDDKTYAMRLTLSPRGAGIDEIALNKFRRALRDDRPYVFQQPYDGYGVTRPLATRWISIDGKQVDLSGVDWAETKGGGGDVAGVTYSVDIVGDDGPVARITKVFTLPRRDAPSLGYEVGVDYRIENLTARPIKVKTEISGPTVPPNELAQSDRLVITGQRTSEATVEAHQHMLDSFTADAPSMELLYDDDKQPAQWVGGASAYFAALLLPGATGENKTLIADYLESIKAERLDASSTVDPQHRKVALTYRTKELDIAPNGALTLPLSAYFGPRSREVLDAPYYTALPRAYSSILVIRVGPCAACTFDWLITGLVVMLGWFHFVWRDWGLAIITLVLIVRALLHPITKRAQVNMMKMGKFGPEIEKLKKKYGDDKDELNRQMVQFYKQHGATPILGCLPMFLQMPIWIALWSVLQSTFELRHEPFLYGLTWIDDLSKPDWLIKFNQPFHLLFFSIDGLNLLPILLAVVFWLNQKYTPKPPATTPEQKQQQKMMEWMVLIFPLFMYSMPSGLLLYIFASTTIGIIESKIVRDHIKQREALEAAQGPVIVDAPPTRGSRRKDRGDDAAGGGGRGKGPEKPAPGGWLGRKLAELQQKAEAIKREAERKGR